MTAKVIFSSEIKSFIKNHKLLCICTLGLAVVGFSLGKLAGRLVTSIQECLGTTKKVKRVADPILQPIIQDDANFTKKSTQQGQKPIVMIEKDKEKDQVVRPTERDIPSPNILPVQEDIKEAAVEINHPPVEETQSSILLSKEKIAQLKIHPSFFERIITEAPILQEVAEDATMNILKLKEFYEKLDEDKQMPDEISDDEHSLNKEDFLNTLYYKIEAFNTYKKEPVTNNVPFQVQENHIPKILALLRHAIHYIEYLSQDPAEENREEIKQILLYEIGRPLIHCSDRILPELEKLYYGKIAITPEFIHFLSFENKVLMLLRAERRKIFEGIIFEVLSVVMNDEQKRHYASSYQYYLRICRQEFALGGDETADSTFENDENLCVKGYEQQVRDKFHQAYNTLFVLDSFLELVNSMDKKRRINNVDVFTFLENRYELNQKERDLLLDDEGKWVPAAAAVVLKDLEILC